MIKTDCIFCAIANKKIEAKIEAESDRVVAFHDLHPVANTHLLIVPKMHLENINDITKENSDIMADMALMAKELAQKLGAGASGYRLVINNNAAACQTVFHLHMHFLAHRTFTWPPG
jgi:histidine triad (HIT) family protein